MAYIGKSPVIGNFVKLDAITAVNGQAAYTMQNGGSNFTDYESVNQFLVSLNGTIQAPTDSFTVCGSTLTFASNLSTGDVIDFIMVFGNSLSAGTPTDDTVTAAKLNNDIISGQTELASEPADTDEFLVSDAGTLKRIDYSLIKSSPAMELLSTNDASSVASVSFDGFFSSTYKNYKVILSNITSSASSTWLTIRFRRSDADITTSNYYNANFQAYRTSSAAGDFNNSEWGASDIHFFVLSGNSSYQGSGEFTLFDPLGTSNYKNITGMGTYWENAGTSYRTTITGAVLQDNTNALSGVTLIPNSGTISGTIKLYGVK